MYWFTTGILGNVHYLKIKKLKPFWRMDPFQSSEGKERRITYSDGAFRKANVKNTPPSELSVALVHCKHFL